MFVERDENGAIKGAYFSMQPGYAEEEIADDHPDLVAFLAPPKKRSWTLSEFKARMQPGELAALGGLLGRQLEPADAALMLDFLTATTLSLAPPGGPDGKLERGLARLVVLNVLTDARRQALLQPE